ncbi:toll-like receptor 8 [Argopecten irradians]|uniref:toll-like receptor 8 n=1 Tax=Argopecten irradians TaxID=31199 RepID=UPI00371FD496
MQFAKWMILFLVEIANGQFWHFQPSDGLTKDNVLCPLTCQSSRYVDRCCSCDSLPSWMVNRSISLRNIYVEYVSVRPSAILVNITDRPSTSFDSVIYASGRLRHFPLNICDYQYLGHIDFSENHIENIANISCLEYLDSLILKGNKLMYISNTTFINLRNLRILDLSHNLIKGMDPNVFNMAKTQIYHTDFSENLFQSMDVTNVLEENPLYCEKSFNHSIFGEFTNVKNYRLNPNAQYGCGKLRISHNKITNNLINVVMEHYPEDYALLSKVMVRGKIVMDETPITCDCHLGLFLTLYKTIKDFERRYFVFENVTEVICDAPPQMTNYTFHDIVYNMSVRHLLECDVKMNCPKGCTCLDQPSRFRLNVDCKNSNLSSLPTKMPETVLPIQLHLANNYISHLEPRDYLKDVSLLDLSNNPVQTLTKAAVYSLGTTANVIFGNHKLQGLPETLRLLDPDQFEFGKTPVPCDCENTWIGDWKRIKGGKSDENTLWCKTSKGTVEAQTATEEFLQCTNTNRSQLIIAFSSVLGVFVLGVAAILSAVYFKFEIMFLARWFRVKKEKSWIHDIYLSFDDDNDDVRGFVLNSLRPCLLEHGYDLYTQCLDGDVGKTIENQLKFHINYSRSFLFVMSDNCQINMQTVLEYKLAFSHFTNDVRRSMVLLDFDHSTPLNNGIFRGSRALKRFGNYIAITDRNIQVYAKLVEMIGLSTKCNMKE